MRCPARLTVLVLTLIAAGCGGDDPPEDRTDVPVVNRTGGAVNTSERATAGEGASGGVIVHVDVGRTDPAEGRIPGLDGVAKVGAGEHECEGQTHGIGRNWGGAGTSEYTFECPSLPVDELTEFEVHTSR